MSFTMNFYNVEIHSIICKLPSSGDDISAQKAISNVLSISGKLTGDVGKIVSVAGPEGEVAGAAIEVVGSLLEVGGEIADLVSLIDREIREGGGNPDALYISVWAGSDTPQPDDDGPSDLYPQKGVAPKDGNFVRLAKNQEAPGLPQTFTVFENATICLWDHDWVSGDDLLWAIPVNASSVGRTTGCFYNALQDSVYYLDYTISKS